MNSEEPRDEAQPSTAFKRASQLFQQLEHQQQQQQQLQQQVQVQSPAFHSRSGASSPAWPSSQRSRQPSGARLMGDAGALLPDSAVKPAQATTANPLPATQTATTAANSSLSALTESTGGLVAARLSQWMTFQQQQPPSPAVSPQATSLFHAGESNPDLTGPFASVSVSVSNSCLEAGKKSGGGLLNPFTGSATWTVSGQQRSGHSSSSSVTTSSREDFLTGGYALNASSSLESVPPVVEPALLNVEGRRTFRTAPSDRNVGEDPFSDRHATTSSSDALDTAMRSPLRLPSPAAVLAAATAMPNPFDVDLFQSTQLRSPSAVLLAGQFESALSLSPNWGSTPMDSSSRPSSASSSLKPALPPRPSTQTLTDDLPLGSANAGFSDTQNQKPPLPARRAPSAALTLDETDSRSIHTMGSSMKTLGNASMVSKINALCPDAVCANRLPPLATLTPHYRHSSEPPLSPTNSLASPCRVSQLCTKSSYYLKTVAMSRGYVCTGATTMKIWNLVDGECVSTVSAASLASKSISTSNVDSKVEPHVTAMCYLSSPHPDHDAKYVWAGWSDGDMWMVNQFTGQLLERRLSAHSHAILHILRCGVEMWTLDENGVLQVWTDTVSQMLTPQRTDSPPAVHAGYVVSLESRPRTHRIGAKQVFAVVVGLDLWTARDKVVEVNRPGLALTGASIHRKTIEILKTVGALTAMGCLGPRTSIPNTLSQAALEQSSSFASQWRVYTGHLDGKVVEWDATSYSRLRLFDMGSYRVTALLGLGSDMLWIAYGTGKVTVLDVLRSNNSLFGKQRTEPSFQETNSQTLLEPGFPGVTVLKEWQALVGEAVEGLVLDLESLVFNGHLLVASHGKSGLIQVWNALFPVDFVDAQVRLYEKEFCQFADLSVFVGSWNVDAAKPDSLDSRADDNVFVDKWVSVNPKGADIYVFGLQEIIDLENKKIAAKGLFMRSTTNPEQIALDHSNRANLWKDRLTKALRDNFFDVKYHLVEMRNLVGLLTCVFVKEQHLRTGSVKHIHSHPVMTGLGGTYGNKGAIITRFLFDETSFCFINAHLPAHQSKVGKRNVDAITILRTQCPPFFSMTGSGSPNAGIHNMEQLCFIRGGDGSQVLDFEYCMFFGDLNYRIDMERDKVIEMVSKDDWEDLRNHDQLLRQRLSPASSAGQMNLVKVFDEGLLTFPPTYKYDRGSDMYDTSDKKRTPAWCDRILYRDGTSKASTSLSDARKESTASGGLRLEKYDRFECHVSDHRPIGALFTARIRSLNSNWHGWDEVRLLSEGAWDQYRSRLIWDAQTRWLLYRLEHPALEAPSNSGILTSDMMDREAVWLQWWSTAQSLLTAKHGDLWIAMQSLPLAASDSHIKK